MLYLAFISRNRSEQFCPYYTARKNGFKQVCDRSKYDANLAF